MTQDYQTDCRFFSGYKPCSKNTLCTSECPQKQIAEPRLLIVHLEALGAVLRGTVLLSAARRQWPNAHITWVTSPAAASLLENNSQIDRLIKNNHEGTLALSALSFDFAFCVDKSLIASGLLNIPKYISESRGFGVDDVSGAIIPLNREAERVYELGLSNDEKFFVNKKSEAQLLVESVGLEWQGDEYSFTFTEEELQFREVERIRLGLHMHLAGPVDGPAIIGLNTGCSGIIPYKKLSLEGWTKLINQLAADYPRTVFLLLGGPEDTGRNAEIKNRVRHLGMQVRETSTTQGLRRGMIYVDLCDAVVTGDSLGMHMAIALKKWTVSWFGPTCAHEIEFYGRGEAVLSQATCSPCWKRECHKPIMCYDLIDFNKISQAVSRGFSKTPASQKARVVSSQEVTSII